VLLSDASAWLAGGFFLSLGVINLVLGILFRFGQVRQVATYYWDSSMPFPIRNGGFGFIPLSVMAFLWVALLVINEEAHETLAGVLLVLSLVSLVSAFLSMYWPPEWLKPQWLRARERAFVGEGIGGGYSVSTTRDKATFRGPSDEEENQ
jgi:hypothetical protein